MRTRSSISARLRGPEGWAAGRDAGGAWRAGAGAEPALKKSSFVTRPPLPEPGISYGFMPRSSACLRAAGITVGGVAEATGGDGRGAGAGAELFAAGLAAGGAEVVALAVGA